MEDPLLEQKTYFAKKLRRRLKTACKATQKIEEQFSEANQWQQKQQEALVLQSNLYQVPLGTKSISLTDWETERQIHYTLDPKKPPQDEVSARFRKAKKLQKGVKPLEEQLKKQQKWEQELIAAIAQLEAAETSDVILALVKKFDLEDVKPISERKAVPPPPYREFFSAKGIPIWVGKSAKDNDVLTFSYANGSDWWLHVSDYSGSHVIIRVKKGAEPDPETLQDAMQLAIFYSKAKGGGKVEVSVTQCKYVVRYKGAKSGAVHLSKHKRILVKENPGIIKVITTRRYEKN